MPYINQERRRWILQDVYLDVIIGRIALFPGDINFVISTIIWTIFNMYKSYTTANMLMGVLQSVQTEFYRRAVAPYEDEKLQENGDLII